MVFPAYAGVIPASDVLKVAWVSVSRVCGGDPTTDTDTKNLTECFPRMRG